MTFKSELVELKEFGCFVKVEDGVIYTCAMMKDGSPAISMPIYDEEDSLDWVEVTDPRSQDFLDAVNKLFHTNFKLSDF